MDGTTPVTAEEIIDEKIIEDREIHGACDAGLNWLRKRPGTLQELRNHNLSRSRWLARHSTIPAVLEKLAGDQDAYVLGGVAQNANTPAAVLEKLAGDQKAYVRGGVAQNANTPVAVLEKLAGDQKAYVRGGVAQNANTPVAVLEKLATDADSYVRCEAKKTLEG
ncbi:MAG: hypothetical protein ACLGPM_07530 [Acidobacteriota bacterium]